MIKVTANRPERPDAAFAGLAGLGTGGIVLGKGVYDATKEINEDIRKLKVAAKNGGGYDIRRGRHYTPSVYIEEASRLKNEVKPELVKRALKKHTPTAALAAAGTAAGIYGGAKVYDYLKGNGVTASEVPHIEVIACGSSCKPTKKKKKVNKSK